MIPWIECAPWGETRRVRERVRELQEFLVKERCREAEQQIAVSQSLEIALSTNSFPFLSHDSFNHRQSVDYRDCHVDKRPRGNRKILLVFLVSQQTTPHFHTVGQSDSNTVEQGMSGTNKGEEGSVDAADNTGIEEDWEQTHYPSQFASRGTEQDECTHRESSTTEPILVDSITLDRYCSV